MGLLSGIVDFFFGDDDEPPAPDYSAVANASTESAKIAAKTAADQLAWAKQKDAADRKILARVLDTQLPAMQSQAAQASAMNERYNKIFLPLEDQYLDSVRGYAAPGRMEQEVGKASATVQQQFDNQRSQLMSRLASFGIDPSRGSVVQSFKELGAQEAAARAGAENTTRSNVEATQRALLADVANFGRNVPSQVAQSYGTALNAGNSAVSNANSTTATGSNALTAPSAYMNVGNSAIGNWTSALNGQGNLYMNAQNQPSGFGTMLGFGASMLGSGADSILGRALGFKDGGPVGYAGEVGPDGVPLDVPLDTYNDPYGVSAPDYGNGYNPFDYGEQEDMTEDDDANPFDLDDAFTYDMGSGQEYIPVAGRKVVGPGTGTSDSIPAVISDTGQQAALSNGEYVIPAHVVRQKGQEFFDKLVAKYADREEAA